MCTRFVHNGNDTIVGFNFDIDLAVWTHTVIKEKDGFYIGIKMPMTIITPFSDKYGRVLIIEPGLGYRLEQAQYSLITNYSVLRPEITKPYIVSGDDRFERADEQLKRCGDNFSVVEAFRILKSVKQEGIWATRVSFVYSVSENNVYYVLNNDFEHILEYQFQKSRGRSGILEKKVGTMSRKSTN